jgi:hypothetical protein
MMPSPVLTTHSPLPPPPKKNNPNPNPKPNKQKLWLFEKQTRKEYMFNYKNNQ